LLIGAGLLFKSLVRTWGVDPGFEPHNVAIFGVGLAPQFFNAPVSQVREEIRQSEQAMATLPGVTAVSMQGAASPMRGEDDITFWRADQPAPQSDSEKNWTLRYIVQPGYLDVMKIPLLRGRFFTPQDTLTSPPVVVVDDVFASTFYPHGDAIGKRVRW